MRIKYLLFNLWFILAFATAKSYAQAPQQFNYQGAAKNANGTLLSNKQIALRISTLNGSATETAQYVETHWVTINQLGLYSVAIGSACTTSTSGTIAGVTWFNGLK